MSELGEYYQKQREKLRDKKAKALEWNTSIVMGLSIEYGFEVKSHTEFHLSLFHPHKGRLDYYPSTGKARWTKDVYKKTFHIKDIEAYLMNNFKPNQQNIANEQ